MSYKKVCFKCAVEKHISEFYKHKGMRDGHLNKCKECTKDDVKKNSMKEENLERIREYKRLWALKEKSKEARCNYKATEEGASAIRLAKDSYIQRNPKKQKAHIAVNNAIRSGELVRSNVCENCGDRGNKIEAHHCDYSKHLDVMWLCRKCHAEWHRFNEAING